MKKTLEQGSERACPEVNLSPEGRGHPRLRGRVRRVEPIERFESPHPNPLPNREREQAEFAARSHHEPQACGINASVRALVLALAALFAITSFAAPAAAQGKEKDKVTVGVFPVSSTLPYFVAV